MQGGEQTQDSGPTEVQTLLTALMAQRAAGASLATILEAVAQATQAVVRAEGVRLVVAGKVPPPGPFGAGPLAAMMSAWDSIVLNRISTHDPMVAMQWPAAALGLPEPLRGAVAIALRAGGEYLGALWCGLAEERLPGVSETGWLVAFAGLAADAIAVANANEQASSLRRACAEMSAVFRHVPDPVLIVDSELRVRLSNPAARRLFAGLDDSADGQLLEAIPELAALAGLVRAGEGQAVPREYSVDDDRSYAVTVGAIPDESGLQGYRTVILQDTTRFRRLNDSMADFLSAVSHDMRTPLTYMKGYLDMLEMVGEVNAKQREFIGIIAGGFAQMSDMVEKILKAGRLDPVTGTYTLERDACDLAEMVREVAASLEAPAAAKRLSLTTTIGDGIPIVNVDRDLVHSALMNLAEIAVKYTPEGGAVWIQLAVEDGTLVFRVQDDGLGISAADQQKLFRRNVRIHRKEWRRVKGSGLGLFIVRNVARRHGGEVRVESVEGQGSTFTLALPLEGNNLIGSTT